VSTNPFEPPRTTDLDGGSGTIPAAFSEAALRELSLSAPWVRWFARVTAISLALGIADGAVTLLLLKNVAGSAGAMVSLGISVTISGMFLAVLRRYASAAERLRGGTRLAALEVIGSQAAYFKLTGVMTIVALALIVLVLVVGLGAGLLADF
jgi:hypothetical protein